MNELLITVTWQLCISQSNIIKIEELFKFIV